MLVFNTAALKAALTWFIPGHTQELLIYSGVQPTLAELMPNNAFDPSRYTGQLLAKGNVFLEASTGVIRFSQPPANLNPTVSGTATWFVIRNIYSSSYLNAIISGAITSAGPGLEPLYINNTTIQVGSPVVLLQLSVKLNTV